MSNPSIQEKAVWLAQTNGVPRVLKCWTPRLERMFDTEAAVYDRLHKNHPAGHHLFPKCIARGNILCST
ncbi:hypothetical protein ACN38_g11481 [Penicillium nordicum]|uniref:Uncharacterized protein n=1 Tax=Penicillium nordicum TaxID=229535 RepID=A0A0N0RXM0_9EURO|nr:hypothetical protein ACN38_g11481 [Penicillium nordicum]